MYVAILTLYAHITFLSKIFRHHSQNFARVVRYIEIKTNLENHLGEICRTLLLVRQQFGFVVHCCVYFMLV
jgi:hypothetical protein